MRDNVVESQEDSTEPNESSNSDASPSSVNSEETSSHDDSSLDDEDDSDEEDFETEVDDEDVIKKYIDSDMANSSDDEYDYDDETDSSQSDHCPIPSIQDEDDWEDETDEFFESIKQNIYCEDEDTTPDNDGTTTPDNDGTTTPDNDGTTTPDNDGRTTPDDDSDYSYDEDYDPYFKDNEDNTTQEAYETYQENIPIHDGSLFNAREIELKHQRAQNARKNINSIKDAYGIKKLGKSCYFNSFMQLILLLPNWNDYIIPIENVHPQQKELYFLIEHVYNLLATTNHTIDLRSIIEEGIQSAILTDSIYEQVSNESGGSLETFINDFIRNDAVSIIQHGENRRTMRINMKLGDFQENLNGVDISTIKDVLICLRDTYIGTSFNFPLSFQVEDLRMALKFVITHPVFHFVSYIRYGTGTNFIEIDDGKVRKVPTYNKKLVHIAVYTRI